MKILVTGMTSAQCNPDAHAKTGNYSGYLVQALRDAGHTVEHRDPVLGDSYDSYDSVIVGLAPIGSMSANRAYGALDAVHALRGDSRLRLLVEAPDPEKLETGFLSILNTPDNLFKSFFSYRKFYDEARVEPHKSELLDTVDWLAHDTWPTTLAPAMPWTLRASVEARLPYGARDTVSLHCLDAWVWDASSREIEKTDRPNYWAYEASSWSKWLPRQNVTWDVVSVPRSSRIESDSSALQMIRDAQGTLIAPARRGLWWSTRFAQSLAQNTPVFTDWEEAQHLDDSFSILPYQFESTQDATIVELQRKAYADGMSTQDQAIKALESALKEK